MVEAEKGSKGSNDVKHDDTAQRKFRSRTCKRVKAPKAYCEDHEGDAEQQRQWSAGIDHEANAQEDPKRRQGDDDNFEPDAVCIWHERHLR